MLGDIEVAPLDLYRELPFSFDVAYDGAATMRDIQQRVLTSGRFIFVYGGYDPWTAVPYDVDTSTGSRRFIAPGLNHSALLLDLEADDKIAAYAALSSLIDAPLNTTARQVTRRQADRLRQRISVDREWLARGHGRRP